ncbi:MAG TPA: MFS transporter [Actinomycetota bacterium]|nr:MFS transporter [Actinomycetota bacterium]
MLKRGLTLLFSKRDFGFLMAVQFAAQAGDGLVQGAIGKFIVFGGQAGFDPEAAPSVDVLLTMALLLFVPYTFISPFLGVVIDRWDRRRLLCAANGVRAGAVVLVTIIGIQSVPNGVLMGLLLLTLASTRLVLAAKAAALPATLGETSLVEGNAISQMGGALFQLAGAGVAIIGSSLVASEPIAIVGAIVYGAGALFALRISHADEGREASTLGREIARVLRNIVDGFKEVARTPKAGAAISTYFWLRFLWTASIIGIGFVAKDLIAGDDNLRLVLTAGGGAVGVALGFLSANQLKTRAKGLGRLVLYASAVAGLGTAVLGSVEIKAAIVLLTFCLGFGFFLAKISLDTLVQEALGDDFRGRAFSLYDIAYNLAWVIAAVVLKLWWEQLGSSLIAMLGVVFLLGLGGLAVWYRRAGLLTVSAA